MGTSSATVVVDLVPKITAKLGRRILTGFLSRVFKLFFPGSPSIINDIPSILYTGRASSIVSPSLATTSIFNGMVGRLGHALVGHQSIYFLLCLILAFKELR